MRKPSFFKGLHLCGESVVRFLGLPAVILFLGFLAALPFRREPETKEVPEHASEGLALPRNVTPIVENTPGRTGNDRGGGNQTLESGFGVIDDASQDRFASPYDLSVERLPKSYEEVAVPLVLDPRSPNLLAAPTRVPTSHLPVQSYQLPVQSGPKVDRFGIPRTPAASVERGGEGAGVAHWSGSGANSSRSDWGWSEQQTIGKIVGTGGNSKVVSDDSDAGNRQQPAMIDGANPTFRMASEHASSSVGQGNTSGGVSSEASSKEHGAGSPNLLDHSQLSRPTVVRPSNQSRPRHIIREPGL